MMHYILELTLLIMTYFDVTIGQRTSTTCKSNTTINVPSTIPISGFGTCFTGYVRISTLQSLMGITVEGRGFCSGELQFGELKKECNDPFNHCITFNQTNHGSTCREDGSAYSAITSCQSSSILQDFGIKFVPRNNTTPNFTLKFQPIINCPTTTTAMMTSLTTNTTDYVTTQESHGELYIEEIAIIVAAGVVGMLLLGLAIFMIVRRLKVSRQEVIIKDDSDRTPDTIRTSQRSTRTLENYRIYENVAITTDQQGYEIPMSTRGFENTENMTSYENVLEEEQGYEDVEFDLTYDNV